MIIVIIAVMMMMIYNIVLPASLCLTEFLVINLQLGAHIICTAPKQVLNLTNGPDIDILPKTNNDNLKNHFYHKKLGLPFSAAWNHFSLLLFKFLFFQPLIFTGRCEDWVKIFWHLGSEKVKFSKTAVNAHTKPIYNIHEDRNWQHINQASKHGLHFITIKDQNMRGNSDLSVG